MALELGRPPTQSKVFARTHTQKEDQLWVDRGVEEATDRASGDHRHRRSRAPPIDEDAVWTRIAGSRKRGRIYGKGVVPSHKYPALFEDPDDDDTATGPPDLREQEVSDLRKAYSDMYSYLSHIRSGSSSSGMPDMRPPPPARSQDPPPQPDQSTGSPQPEDESDYI
ncbi:hypothetical protein PIB30_057397 [Stylosanthes scabra]|uniref:Uncharacterized protein n=1 Tax=Stylosanthes scabra TaxID=79078 RepID=A0ABU6VI45_9FABA|nr:hypothetical protein [Stylosanthes scabra]